MSDGGGILVVIIVGIIALGAWAVVSDKKEQEQWEAFALEHKCKLVEHKKGDVRVSTATTVTSGGGVAVTPITTVTPDKSAYKCDDDVTYWR